MAAKSYIVVSNHRSFFDLYVVTAYLVKRGMPHRLMFPVRSQFFYDKRVGLVVNGLMSFFAMYPPVFRERARAAKRRVIRALRWRACSARAAAPRCARVNACA